MDEHKEREEENKFQESPEQLQAPRKQEAEDSSEESIDQQQHQSGGYKEGMRNAAEDDEEEETVVVQLKEVVETGSAPWVLGVFANPCSLLQYLLRACARLCCGLHGAFDDGPKPQQPPAAAAIPEAAVAPANSAEQGDGDKANYFYMRGVLAVRRRGRPPLGSPDRPREGRGGNGGVHN